MTPEYYEGVVLAIIAQGIWGQNAIFQLTGLGRTTLIKAIRRLEAKKRLLVTRHPGRASEYTILDPPTEFDRKALAVHLESRNRGTQ